MKQKNIIIQTILVAIALAVTHASFFSAIPLTNANKIQANTETAKILITEVNFNNKENDFVKFKYIGQDPKLNLKGFSFEDDKVFKTVTADFWVEPSQIITLRFKTPPTTDAGSPTASQTTNSNYTDAPPNLYTEKSGLTATTEQIIIYDSGKNILDAVCWASSTPAKTELKDLTALFRKAGWRSDQMTDCVESEPVKPNQSIVRKSDTDTDSKSDWELQELTKPVATKKTATASANAPKSTSSKTSPSKTTGTTSPKSRTSKSKSTKPKTSSSKKNSSAKIKYQNGDLSSEIIISEFMPNPKGTDTKNEWIELYNNSSQDLNLGNWQLDDIEGGSKPYVIPNVTIKAKSALLIKSDESKLSLGNTSDQVRLFNYNNELIDSIDYEESPEGQSYGSINIVKEDIGGGTGRGGSTGTGTGKSANADESGDASESTPQRTWLWLKNPTPGEPNPQYTQITATIYSEPVFAETYYFQIKTADEKMHKILFDEGIIAATLAKVSFQKGATIQVFVTINSDETFNLQKYQILAPPKTLNSNSTILISIAAAAITILTIGLFLIKWLAAKKD